MSNKPTLLLVDGSSYLYRAYHAMGQNLSAPDGAPTGAMYGVLNMLRRLRADYVHDYCAVVFDAKGKNFRHEMFPDYKATRPPMPDDLRPQAEALPDLVRLMGWPVLVIPQVEADDVIGTLAKMASEAGWNVVVSTGDKDMAQLVNERVTLVNTMSGETLDIEGVKEKFGVRPDQIRDYLALMGDKVDNVPGVEKCGPKTAVKWLEAYGSLVGVMEHAGEVKGKVGENLQAALEQLPLSYDLVTIKTDLDLHTELSDGLESLRRTTPKWAQLVVDFKRWGFRTWLKEAESRMHEAQNTDLFGSEHIGEQAALAMETQPEKQPELAPVPEKLDYQAVTTEAQFTALLDKLAQADKIGIDTETTSLDAMNAALVGISIAFQAGEAVYIPVGHSLTAAPEQLDLQDVLGRLKPHLENPALKKIGQNLKYDQHVFANYDIALNSIAGDSMLASYIIESHLGHGLDELSERWLGLETITYESLCGKGAKQISFADVAIGQATEYAAQDADFALRLEAHLRAQMDTKQLEMYEKMELPVAQVLFEMERNGVQIDRAELARQSAELGAELMKLEQEAYAAAGQPFNLNSPKQLQEILFDKMGIPTKGLKKTAKGGISTNEAVLEQLAPDYPLPKIILQNRSLAKLKSTYTDKLPEMISPKDGRVPYHLRPSRRHHRPPRQQQPQPAKHPHPHRRRPPRASRLYRTARQRHRFRRLFPNRAAHHGAPLRRQNPHYRVPKRRRRTPPHRRRSVRHLPRKRLVRTTPLRQNHQLRPDLRHGPIWPCQIIGHRQHLRQKLYRPLLRPLPRRRRIHAAHQRTSRRARLRRNPVRPSPLPARHPQQKRQRPRRSRTRRHQRPYARHRVRPHQTRYDRRIPLAFIRPEKQTDYAGA